MFGSNWTFLLIFFLLTFGHHVKFKCAQGRKIIVPVASNNTAETVVNILLTSPARPRAKMIIVVRNHFKQPVQIIAEIYMAVMLSKHHWRRLNGRMSSPVSVVCRQQRVSKTHHCCHVHIWWPQYKHCLSDLFKEDVYSGGHVCVSLTVDSLTSLLPKANYSLRRFLGAWLEFGVWSHLCAYTLSLSHNVLAAFSIWNIYCYVNNVFLSGQETSRAFAWDAIMFFGFFSQALVSEKRSALWWGHGPWLVHFIQTVGAQE